jgi:hypothetical protein
MRRLTGFFLSLLMFGLVTRLVEAQEAIGRVLFYETGQPAAQARVTFFALEDLGADPLSER